MKEPKIAPTDERGFLLNWSKELKKSYRATARIVKKSIKQCAVESKAAHKGIESEHSDESLKKGMLEDLNIAINQMHTGRVFGSKRGIERRNVYDAEEIIDPLYIQEYFEPSHSRSSYSLTTDHKEQIDDALSGLTKQEWTCYVMSRGYCASFGEIASMLGISKGNVHKCVKRAERKVNKALEESMFLREFKWERDKEDE